ncbi:putative gustatory receptor 39b [Drosophila pseudoobscura]|uniref:Gustatory receptor n=1 Tax=Drosophila pseudoobscura pseudoobscura TaxID=46245 RepID=A0A6I8UIK8_DROPS|nr:putative gustatory receptor 39b [Drosophila pseudoobscura]
MLYRLQSCLKYFALLGIVPWTETCGPCQYFQKIYSIFLMSINLVIFGMEIHIPQKDSLLLSLLVSAIVFIAKVLCMTVILLQMMCQYEGYYGFCKELQRVRERLEVQLKMGALLYPRRRYIKIMFLGIASLGTMASLIYTSFIASLMYFWSSCVALIIIRLQCVLLLFYVDLMGFHVELLGKRIRDVLHCHSSGGNCVPDGNCKQLRSLEFLLELKQSHMEVFDLFSHFNDLFGWSILSIFVVMFMDGTVNIYWTQQVLAGVYGLVYLNATFSFSVPSLALIFAFCRCGEYCKRQQMLIGSYVRGLAYGTPSLQQSKEPAYTELLTEFTLQVEHNVLAINAEGFMVIDNSLLMSMFAAMVTYLIVLMQFSAS